MPPPSDVFPIHSAADHRRALRLIEGLMDAKPGTPEFARLEIMGALAAAWEDSHQPMEPVDPIEAIRFRMEQGGVDRKVLAGLLGGRVRVSEILNRKRKLTMEMVRRLHAGLGIPLESLIADYELSTGK